MGVKGTKTEQNLLKAFAGESQARNRYGFFASVAKKEGFEQISAIFLETAENEREHAKIFFDYLEGGPAEITATYPAGKTGEHGRQPVGGCRRRERGVGRALSGVRRCGRSRRVSRT